MSSSRFLQPVPPRYVPALATWIIFVVAATGLGLVAIRLGAMWTLDWTWEEAQQVRHSWLRIMGVWALAGAALLFRGPERFFVRANIRRQARLALGIFGYGLAGALIGFWLQLYVVNRRLDGFNNVAANHPGWWVTPEEYWRPVLFWALVAMAVFAFIGYVRSAVWRQLGRAWLAWWRGLQTIRIGFGWRHVGWCLFAVGLAGLASRGFGRQISVVAGVLLILHGPTLLYRGWQRLLLLLDAGVRYGPRRLAGRDIGARLTANKGEAALTVVVLGLALVAAGWLEFLRGLIPALLFMAGGLTLVAWRPFPEMISPVAGSWLLLVGAVLSLAVLLDPAAAMADDGTWNTGTLSDLRRDSGGDRSIGFARDLGEGTGAGAGLGGGLGERTDDDNDELRTVDMDRVGRRLGITFDRPGAAPSPPGAVNAPPGSVAPPPGVSPAPPPGDVPAAAPHPSTTPGADAGGDEEEGLPLDLRREDGERPRAPRRPPEDHANPPPEDQPS